MFDDPSKALPPIGSLTLEQAKRLLEDGLYYTHPLYSKWKSEWRRAELFDQGLQWLQRGAGGFDRGGNLSQWVSVYHDEADPNYIPTPVFNEGHGSRTNESARIGRPNYRPLVSPKSENPNYRVKQKSKRATDLLRHLLREMEWDKQSYLMYYHIPVYGGAWLKSEWEERWDRTTKVPVEGAVKCADPTCDFRMASKQLSNNEAAQVPTAGVGADGRLRADYCPQCPSAPPLLPFQPTLDEAKGNDSLGRPLGRELPLGDWKLSVRSPFGMHPKNLGFGMQGGDISEWREVHIETLDWVALHYPEKAVDVKPERPDVLMKDNPVLGAPDVFGAVLDQKLLHDSVRIQEWHKKPWMERQQTQEGRITFRLNKGRSVLLANNVILLDAPYMIPSQTDPSKEVARVEVDYIPWEVKDGGRYLQGMSLWSLLFDPQRNANEIRSQAQSIRQRLALPLYIALKSHNLQMATRDGVPGRFAFIDVDPEAPHIMPQLLNNTTIADGAWKELQDTVSSLEKYAGNVEVEKGQVPPNVSAALAIQYLKTYAGEKREPRIARIKEGLRRVWRHGLDLVTALYLEPREVSYEDEAGDERWEKIEGQDLLGETSVMVEAQADFDDRARNQELVLTLIERGVIQPAQNPTIAREVARILEAPESLFELQDLQKDGAQREYLQFKEENRIPVVDPTLDDHLAHYQQHGIDAQSDYFRNLEDEAAWDDALKILSVGWDQELQMLAMQGGPPCLQDKIFGFWLQKLQMAAQPQPVIDPATGLPVIDPMTGMSVPPTPPSYAFPADPEGQEALKNVLYWRAHNEEHRLVEVQKQMQSQMQPVLAAPGGAAAAAGTQPNAVTPPQQ